MKQPVYDKKLSTTVSKFIWILIRFALVYSISFVICARKKNVKKKEKKTEGKKYGKENGKKRCRVNL